MTDLIATVKKEGALNVIALPPDWANHGEIMAKFIQNYPAGLGRPEETRV